MARPLRICYPGAFYHITARGNERKAIFKSNQDRVKFLSYLETAHKRYGALIHGYCLMDNHYHLLLETPGENLSQVMHHINGAYTTYYNVKRKRSGHLFQGRYKAIVVEKDAYCQELSRYIHLNPVRAGIVKSVDEYPWSSYLSYIGKREEVEWLETGYVLAYFGKRVGTARRKYREFVEEAIGKSMEDPLKQVHASTILGGASFIAWVQDKIEGNTKESDRRDVPALKALTSQPSLQKIQQVVAEVLKDDVSLIRKVGMCISQDTGGHTLGEIGQRYGMQGAAVCQSNRRFRQKIEKDRRLKNIVREVQKKLEM